MELRKLTQKDVPAAKELWKEAFGDSDAFVEFYFANKVKLKNTMGAFIGGRLAGDITMQEMLVRLRGRDVPTGFLAGCATKQEYRNRGIMAGLLYAQMRAMDRQGYALCHLHPFLHAFYRKFGWETVSFMRKKTKRPLGRGVQADHFAAAPDYKWLLPAYNDFCAGSQGHFLRSAAQMAVRLKEHAVDGGGILAAGGAYAMFFETGSGLDVIEFVWRSAADREALLARLASRGKTVRYLLPDFAGTSGGWQEYTMMRVVNARRLLERLSLPDCAFTLEVRDDFLPWNNTALRAAYRNGRAEITEYSGKTADIRADARQLAQLAAGKTSGFSGTAAQIFSAQSTVFFNTY